MAVRQSKSLEDWEFGKRFPPLWEISAAKFMDILLERDDTGIFIVSALSVPSRVLSIKDRRNGVVKPVFKLAPLGNGLVDCANRDLWFDA